MVTVVPFSRETVTIVKSPSINPCDCLNNHTGTGVVEFVPADVDVDYDNVDRCMISIGEEEEEYYDYEYDCEYESDLQEVASAHVDGDVHESASDGAGNDVHAWVQTKAPTLTAPSTDSRFTMRDWIYDHRDCDATAGQRNFATQSHPPTMNKIETLNLVTVNANAVASYAAAAAAAAVSGLQTLGSDTVKAVGARANNTDSDEHMCHQQQYQHQSSVDVTDAVTETLCTEPVQAPPDRCMFVPAVFRRRDSANTPRQRSRCTTPVHRRRSPLVEVTIDADVCGDRKETVIAGWVYCEEELTINTDLSCEDSECDHGCHCFGVPHTAKHHDHELDCDHHHPSAVINQFMFKKRASPPLDDFDLRFYKEEAHNRATLIDSAAAGKYHHHHVIHQHDDDDAYDRCYTETESETSYEGDDEVSIPELLSGVS